MSKHGLTLSNLDSDFSVCSLSAGSDVPVWASRGDFFSITGTADELSVVCESSYVPSGIKAEAGWRALKVAGPLDFGLIGILASLTLSLASEGISIFAISTFDTDYLLVKHEQLHRAQQALIQAGHKIAL
ncbi:MAG: ACT domain-containing protein [Cellvibrionaceae bacterium]|nr:ACT domain-containing protein [Cellvibrionaceae bacterium]